MSFYEDMRGVASEILAEFKQGAISYVELTPGAGPVDDPGAPTLKKYPLDGAVRGVKYSYVAKGLAVATDLQVTAAVFGAQPDMHGFIEIDGVTYKIVEIIPKPAAGTTVAFTFIVRK